MWLRDQKGGRKFSARAKCIWFAASRRLEIPRQSQEYLGIDPELIPRKIRVIPSKYGISFGILACKSFKSRDHEIFF
jgi:hypothetical protein